MTKRVIPWTNREVSVAAELYREGQAVNEISATLEKLFGHHRSPASIAQRLRHLRNQGAIDVPQRANAWTREELQIVERILSLRAEIRELKRRLSSRRTSGAIRVRFSIVSKGTSGRRTKSGTMEEQK